MYVVRSCILYFFTLSYEALASNVWNAITKYNTNYYQYSSITHNETLMMVNYVYFVSNSN